MQRLHGHPRRWSRLVVTAASSSSSSSPSQSSSTSQLQRNSSLIGLGPTVPFSSSASHGDDTMDNSHRHRTDHRDARRRHNDTRTPELLRSHYPTAPRQPTRASQNSKLLSKLDRLERLVQQQKQKQQQQQQQQRPRGHPAAKHHRGRHGASPRVADQVEQQQRRRSFPNEQSYDDDVWSDVTRATSSFSGRQQQQDGRAPPPHRDETNWWSNDALGTTRPRDSYAIMEENKTVPHPGGRPFLSSPPVTPPRSMVDEILSSSSSYHSQMRRTGSVDDDSAYHNQDDRLWNNQGYDTTAHSPVFGIAPTAPGTDETGSEVHAATVAAGAAPVPSSIQPLTPPHGSTHWNEYTELLKTALSRRNFERIYSEEPKVLAFLQSHHHDQNDETQISSSAGGPYAFSAELRQALRGEDTEAFATSDHQEETPSSSDIGTFRDLVAEQKARFMQEYDLSNDQHKLIHGVLSQVTNLCAKQAMGGPTEIIWAKFQQAGFSDLRFLSTLLHVAGSFGSRRKRGGFLGSTASSSTSFFLDLLSENPSGPTDASRESSIPSSEETENIEKWDAVDEIATFHDFLHQPTEQSLQVRIKQLVGQGNGAKAESLLLQHESAVTFRLRAYTPILWLYMEQKQLSAALALYSKMRESALVHIDSDVYTRFLACLAEQGVFGVDAPPIEGATELGFSEGRGPALWNELVTGISEDIIEIPMNSVRNLKNAMADGYPESGLERISSLAPVQLENHSAHPSEEMIASRISIDRRKGICPRTGVTLQLKALSAQHVEKLKNGLRQLAIERHDSFRKEYNVESEKQSADSLLMEFLAWLDRRQGEPFTAVVDGANVGYYMQNFQGGRFSYHQIEFVVNELERLGENPLVVIPRKYTMDFFTTSIGSTSAVGAGRQRLTTAEKRIRKELSDRGKLAIVPSGILDDFYWILASVSEQTTSRAGRSLHVTGADGSGRWPGARPVLITNDLMRDHRLGLLEPIVFRRWFSNFIVNYNFAAFVGSQCTHPEIGFSPADFYSREIQENLDTHGRSVWHFPVSDAVDEWFCVRLPQK